MMNGTKYVIHPKFNDSANPNQRYARNDYYARYLDYARKGYDLGLIWVTPCWRFRPSTPGGRFLNISTLGSPPDLDTKGRTQLLLFVGKNL